MTRPRRCAVDSACRRHSPQSGYQGQPDGRRSVMHPPSRGGSEECLDFAAPPRGASARERGDVRHAQHRQVRDCGVTLANGAARGQRMACTDHVRFVADEASETNATCTPAPAPFPGMVWIPGGTFRMGSSKHYPEERPVHRVTVDGFWIDRHPVTNARFQQFVAATNHVTFAEIPPDPKRLSRRAARDAVCGLARLREARRSRRSQ